MIIDGVEYCDECHRYVQRRDSSAQSIVLDIKSHRPPSPEPLTEPERQRWIAQAAEMGAEIEWLRRTVAGLRRVIADSNERPATTEWRVDL